MNATNMPLKDRYYYSNNHDVIDFFQVRMGIISSIGIMIFVLIFAVGLLKFSRNLIKEKRNRYILILLMVIECIVIVHTMFLVDKYKEVKESIDSNEKNLRYITYHLDGYVEKIHKEKLSKVIKFKDQDKVYSIRLNNDVPIKIGDSIEVKTKEKIPTSDDYDQTNLTENSSKKNVKLNVIINNHKIDYQTKDIEYYSDDEFVL